MSVNSFAQQYYEIPKRVICASTSEVFKVLAEESVSENPVWVGVEENGKTQVSVFMNAKTGTFTIVEFTKDFACILSMGTKAENLSGNHL